MERCVVCGNAYEKAFRVIFPDESSYVFDSFECAIQELAPRCAHCSCRIIGHGLERGGRMFCCEHCSRSAESAQVDASSKESFPASDAPTYSPSARESARRRTSPGERLQSGRIGWIALWLLGVPIPILLLLYVLRGCT
jgi:hypothetical protein